MTAMERTNLLLAKVLDLALTEGVSHWSLSFSDLSLSDDYATHFFPCVEWLEAEGLIRVGKYIRTLDGIATGSIENISLTVPSRTITLTLGDLPFSWQDRF